MTERHKNTSRRKPAATKKKREKPAPRSKLRLRRTRLATLVGKSFQVGDVKLQIDLTREDVPPTPPLTHKEDVLPQDGLRKHSETFLGGLDDHDFEQLGIVGPVLSDFVARHQWEQFSEPTVSNHAKSAERITPKRGGRPRKNDVRDAIGKLVAQQKPWKEIASEMDKRGGITDRSIEQSIRAYQYLWRTRK